MDEQELLAYVRAAARLLELPLDAARAEAVALHLGRTAVLARALEAPPLGPQDEPVSLFCPAPFPADDAEDA